MSSNGGGVGGVATKPAGVLRKRYALEPQNAGRRPSRQVGIARPTEERLSFGFSPLAYMRRRLFSVQLLTLLFHFWRRQQAKVVEVENRMLLSSLAWFTSLFCLVLMVCSCCLKACRRFAFSDGGGHSGGGGGGRRRSRGRQRCCDSCSPSRGAPSMCSADVAATPAAKHVLHWRPKGGVSEDGVLSSPGVSSWEQAAAAEGGGDERVASGF